MNEELQIAVTELINKAIKGAEGSADFLSGQLPEYIQQLLTWHAIYSLVFCFVAVVFAIVLIWIDYRFFLLAKESDEHYAWPAYVLAGSIVRMALWSLFVIWPFSLTWIKIWVAPKVFLVDYAAGLVK